MNENVLGYSESLVSGSAGDVTIRVDENSEFDYTLLGNNEGLKNLVISLGVLKNLPPPEPVSYTHLTLPTKRIV